MIRAFNDANNQVLMRMTPAKFESNLPVGGLLRQALQKPDYLIVGAPAWMDRERYSITANRPTACRRRRSRC